MLTRVFFLLFMLENRAYFCSACRTENHMALCDSLGVWYQPVDPTSATQYHLLLLSVLFQLLKLCFSNSASVSSKDLPLSCLIFLFSLRQI